MKEEKMTAGKFKSLMRDILIALVKAIIIILVTIFDILTLPVYILIQNPCKRLSASKRIKSIEINVGNPNCITYRSLDAPKSISKMLSQRNLVTVNDIFKLSSSFFQFRRCLGIRKVYSEICSSLENGKRITKYELGPYIWKSFNTVTNEVKALSKGLYAIGSEEKQPIVIFSETRAEWMIVALACFERNIPLAMVNVTMHEEGIIHSVNITEPKLLITSCSQLSKLSPIIHRFPTLKVIIYFEHEDNSPDLSSFPDSLIFLTYRSVCQIGREIQIVSATPSPDDAAVITFTSGTTGIPKGVVVTHRNLVSTIRLFTDLVEPTPEDVMIGYLPQASIFEFASELVALIAGVGIGYSSPVTLTDNSLQVKEGTQGDASVLKPSIFLATPLILERISRGIKRKVSNTGKFYEAIFDFAVAYKKFWHFRGFNTPLVNSLMFRKISSVTGGEVRLIVCGGAPLSPVVQLHLSLCLCTCVIQGYGLTETTGCGLSQKLNALSLGQVGGPLTEAYIRLCEVEGDHISAKYPTGELLIGGAFVSPGYYKAQDRTDRSFFRDGYIWWFHTGDIAMVYPDGAFTIIDRIKDKSKLQHGEYIYLEKVEAEFKTNKYVDNICLHVDPTKCSPVAIISPVKESIEELCASYGFTDEPIHDLFNEQEINDAVINDLNTHAQLCKMNRFEIPIMITFVNDEWTPDNGLMTAQYKLVRREIYKKYDAEIKAMYDEIIAKDMPHVGEITKIIYSLPK